MRSFTFFWGAVLCLTLCISDSSLRAADDEAGFHSIFNGTSLEGWRPWTGDEGFWRIEEGAITGESTVEKPLNHNTFLVWDHGEVDDFELRLQFKLTGDQAKANSGIQFRGQQAADGHVIGYQADIDLAGQWAGSLHDEAGRGGLAARGAKSTITADGKKTIETIGDAAELFKHIKPSDWNEYSITCHGNHITLKVNGHVTCELIDDQKDPGHDASKQADRIGLLALQMHVGPPQKVQFKNIRLKRLPLAEGKKVVFVAGKPSHNRGAHEHNAGCLLLAKGINDSGLPVIATVYRNGWPKDPTALDNADTVVAYCDGGARHFLNDRLDEFQKLVDARGVGLVCVHYGVETTIGNCGDHFLSWIGGFFEPHWSVNPHWTAKYTKFPEHPTTRGVAPFEINDEWYYHMRFPEGMKNVTPILTDLPPRESLSRDDGPHSGNPAVRAAVLERKEPQHMAWAYDRPDNKGRGFGFTGGHEHKNWKNDNFRKVVLNAIVWTAGLEVPAEGVTSATPSDAEIEANMDEPKEGGAKAAPQKKAAASGNGSHELVDSVSQLDVGEGLEASLFAGEPNLLNPTDIDIDHLGRVWVCEAVNYRAFANKDLIGDKGDKGDRLMVLEDTDGDGKCDKSTVFFQGHEVDSAQGICVLGNRVIISVGDKVWNFIDDNGDLKADRHELMFSGISGTQHDHGIHAFVFGPDGKLYFNFGNAGKQIRDKDGKPIVDLRGNVVDDTRHPYQEGMIFRCDLDGSNFETLAWNFRNNWEVTVDSFGGIWQSDNDDDGNRGVRINYVVEYGNYGYKDEKTGAGWQAYRTGWESEIPLRHWHLNDPGVIPNMLQTGAGAPTGICLYEGELLPAVFRGQPIHCDAGPNVVRAYPTKQVGAGYSAEMVNVLYGARDNWFRPSDVCVAPDGSLMISDWYDPGVGGHKMGDADKGRIFRVAIPGAKYVIPKYDFTTPEGAVEALKSPNLEARYLAWQALHGMGEKAEAVLTTLWKDKNPRFRARAFWLLGKQENRDKRVAIMQSGLRDADADIRCAAVRLARQLVGQYSMDEIGEAINIHDPSPAVRREILIGLREIDLAKAPQIAEVWAELANQYDGQDRWYLESLGIAADGRWDAMLDAWRYAGGNSNSAAGRDILWRSRGNQTADALAKIISDPTTTTAQLPRYFRSFDFLSGAGVQTAIAELAFSEAAGDEARKNLIVSEAITRLQKDVASSPKYAAAVSRVLEAQKGTSTFVRLVDTMSLKDHYPELLELAVSKPEEQLGVEAATALLRKEQWDMFSAALHGDPAKALATITVLGLTSDGKAVDLLMAPVKDDKVAIDLRRAAAKSLGNIRAGAQELAKLSGQNGVPTELKDVVAATLHGAQWGDIKELANKLYPLPPGKDSEPIPPLAELAKRTGDIANGRIVFNTTGTCNKCHIVNGIGREVGPNISEIGKKLSKQAMFESILYPSAGISHNFEQWSITTVDGQVFVGLLVSSTDTETQIKDINGLVKTFKAAEIEDKVKQSISLMPADLQKVMSVKELTDVVEYLTTLKEVVPGEKK